MPANGIAPAERRISHQNAVPTAALKSPKQSLTNGKGVQNEQER